MKIYARKIVASEKSRIDLSAPNWCQEFTNPVYPGSKGEDGEEGVNGPQGMYNLSGYRR